MAGNPGDIVFNANPYSGGTIGWCYTIDNGWYSFGGVSGDKDQNVQFADKFGVATNSLTSSGVSATLQVGSGSSLFHIDGSGGVGIGTTANGAKLRVAGGNILGTFVGDGSGLVNLSNDSLWTNSPTRTGIYPAGNKTVGIRNINPSSSWALHVGTNNAGTNDLLVENKSRFDGNATFNSPVTMGKLTVNKLVVSNTTTFDSGSDPSVIVIDALQSDDIKVGNNVLRVKSSGGVSIGRTDARADLDVDGTMRMKTYYEVASSVSSVSNVVTINLSDGQTFLLNVTEEVSRFTLTDVPVDSTTSFTIKITQGNPGRTVNILDFRKSDGSTIPVYWNGNVNPIVTTTANATDIYSFMTFDGGNTLYGVVTGQNFG